MLVAENDEDRGVSKARRIRRKVVEWTRRYLPLEIAGWIGELGGAFIAYLWTGSLAAAAIVATVGSSVGYYTPAYVNAVRWTWPQQSHRRWPARVAVVNLVAARSLTVEFGFAEVVDSAAIRPALYYLTPILLNHVVMGWIVGGFIADAVFYVFTIFSYERFGRWLAHRPERSRSDEPAAAPAPVLP